MEFHCNHLAPRNLFRLSMSIPPATNANSKSNKSILWCNQHRSTWRLKYRNGIRTSSLRSSWIALLRPTFFLNLNCFSNCVPSLSRWTTRRNSKLLVLASLRQILENNLSQWPDKLKYKMSALAASKAKMYSNLPFSHSTTVYHEMNLMLTWLPNLDIRSTDA